MGSVKYLVYLKLKQRPEPKYVGGLPVYKQTG